MAWVPSKRLGPLVVIPWTAYLRNMLCRWLLPAKGMLPAVSLSCCSVFPLLLVRTFMAWVLWVLSTVKMPVLGCYRDITLLLWLMLLLVLMCMTWNLCLRNAMARLQPWLDLVRSILMIMGVLAPPPSVTPFS